MATIERLKRIEAMALKEITRLLKDLDCRKMEREQVRLRKLFEALRLANLRKYGAYGMPVPD